jgi:uncharacterized membrane protein
LIFYINHVAVIIQVNTVVNRIAGEFHRAIRQNYRPPEGSARRIPEASYEMALAAPLSGYIQWIDYSTLVLAAVEADAVIRFLFRPGQFAVEGVTLAVAACGKHPGNELQNEFRHAVRIGIRRTLRQDTEFAIAQIVEIALRAMSPAVNDPNTALTCVDWLGDGLRALAQYPLSNPAHVDKAGTVRVIEKTSDFESAVRAAFDPIRQVARNSPMLSIRLLNTISGIAPFMQTAAQKAALLSQADMAFEGLALDMVSRDRADVAAAHQRALQALEPVHSPGVR